MHDIQRRRKICARTALDSHRMSELRCGEVMSAANDTRTYLHRRLDRELQASSFLSHQYYQQSFCRHCSTDREELVSFFPPSTFPDIRNILFRWVYHSRVVITFPLLDICISIVASTPTPSLAPMSALSVCIFDRNSISALLSLASMRLDSERLSERRIGKDILVRSERQTEIIKIKKRDRQNRTPLKHETGSKKPNDTQ